LRYVPHFLSLPSDPAVASNALAIRIVFPLVGVTPVSCDRPGLPAALGKQNSRLSWNSRLPEISGNPKDHGK